MAPKKEAEVASSSAVRFGRMKGTLSAGLVGLPNVGKSSLFNLLTHQSVPAENYPFCSECPSHDEARPSFSGIRGVSRSLLLPSLGLGLPHPGILDSWIEHRCRA